MERLTVERRPVSKEPGRHCACNGRVKKSKEIFPISYYQLSFSPIRSISLSLTASRRGSHERIVYNDVRSYSGRIAFRGIEVLVKQTPLEIRAVLAAP